MESEEGLAAEDLRSDGSRQGIVQALQEAEHQTVDIQDRTEAVGPKPPAGHLRNVLSLKLGVGSVEVLLRNLVELGRKLTTPVRTRTPVRFTVYQRRHHEEVQDYVVVDDGVLSEEPTVVLHLLELGDLR